MEQIVVVHRPKKRRKSSLIAAFGAVLLTVFFVSGCEEVIVVELPSAQNQLVVESWLYDVDTIQYVQLTRSNAFDASDVVESIETATVLLQSRNGEVFNYLHSGNGLYLSTRSFAGEQGVEYRIRIQLEEGLEVRSEWDAMPTAVPINGLFTDSFRENDPDDPSTQITLYYPKVIARDPEDESNFYRWRFFRNDTLYVAPESITIQEDLFFDGNLIPNTFDEFSYQSDDTIIVQMQSISSLSYQYLSLLKSQITTLGTTTGTTPSTVTGNLSYLPDTTLVVLGYFGTAAISADTVVVP